MFKILFKIYFKNHNNDSFAILTINKKILIVVIFGILKNNPYLKDKIK